MNTFNRKSLYAALAGVGFLGATGAAQAVNVNPDGLGQALVYSYYTTNGVGPLAGTVAPYNSLLSVVNSTASGKVVKVRFLEGRASKEVLDFNLWLSPFDVWTVAILPTSNGGAGIATADLSCTTPTVSSNAASPTLFVNSAYVGDPEVQTLARTKEGYVEIIEMGVVTGGTLANITHAQPSPPGTPPGCGKLPTGGVAPTDLVVGTGGLFGGISLINPLAGGDITEDAVALANFNTQSTNWAAAGSTSPDLSAVGPKTSVVFNNVNNVTTVITSTWTGINNQPVDPVSAVLMHDNIYNEFVLDPGTKSGTDWVITMPTKHFYYNSSFNLFATPTLFQRNFRAGGACDDVQLTVFNREEQSVLTSFSPPPPNATNSLCWEANVLTFNNSNVLLSQNTLNVPTTFQNGWMALNFLPTGIAPAHQLISGPSTVFNTNTGATVANPSETYNGLPVVGFAVQLFNNGTLTGPGGLGVQAFYTGSFIHRYTRLITP